MDQERLVISSYNPKDKEKIISAVFYPEDTTESPTFHHVYLDGGGRKVKLSA
ncbi:hypothetical protein E4U23_005280 [Claviceps purpurea]|nr:hypothetical protein E4U23_005280 [Claviceps purpurea]